MPKIDEIWAYIATDTSPNDEGIAAFLVPGKAWIPMVGADKERMESLRATAQKVADGSGSPVTLCRFSVREELEVIYPEGAAS